MLHLYAHTIQIILQYSVTMFIVDVSPSMSTQRTLDIPGPNGETRTKQATHLQWSLQFAMLKIQEMVCIVSSFLSLPYWVFV